MKHKEFRIRCTQRRNVAACQLHNHLLSTAISYDCCCLVPTLHISPYHISKCSPFHPFFPHLPFCSNGPLRTLSRPGEREDYEIVLTRNPPNQYRELMELDAKSLSDGSTAHCGLP
jgi:hypothetical protein